MPASEYQALMERISSIHEAIQSIDGFDFANPRNIADLPFPSPLQIPKERFTDVSKGDDIEDDGEGDGKDDGEDDSKDDSKDDTMNLLVLVSSGW